MKKIKTILLSGLFVAFLCTSVKVQAQAPAAHVFHVNTQYSSMMLDSASRAERNAILKEYHEKVTMKNELILHVWTMGHFFTEDSREFAAFRHTL